MPTTQTKFPSSRYFAWYITWGICGLADKSGIQIRLGSVLYVMNEGWNWALSTSHNSVCRALAACVINLSFVIHKLQLLIGVNHFAFGRTRISLTERSATGWITVFLSRSKQFPLWFVVTIGELLIRLRSPFIIIQFIVDWQTRHKKWHKKPKKGSLGPFLLLLFLVLLLYAII